MTKKNIIDMSNPKVWVTTIKKQLEVHDIEIPTDEHIKSLACYNHVLSSNDIKMMNLFKQFKIRLYHACRTNNIESYYKNGLIVPNKKDYHNLFNLYCEELSLDISKKQMIQGHKLIEDMEIESKIFFTLMPDILVKHSGHYLSYGSEKIFYILQSILGQKAYYLIENKFGKATIFIVDFPICNLYSFRQQIIYREIILCLKDFSEYGEYYTEEDCWHDKNILPKYISNHYHPNEFYCYHTHRMLKS